MKYLRLLLKILFASSNSVNTTVINNDSVEIDFLISKFNISGEPIPEKICDKILKYHIVPMQNVRNELNISIWASLMSGYRSEEWELSHGRDGGSQHVFKDKGAVDWTCKDFANNKDKFLEAIIKHTDYTRIAVYDTFIHCDYKHTISQRRELYSSNSASEWEFIKYI